MIFSKHACFLAIMASTPTSMAKLGAEKYRRLQDCGTTPNIIRGTDADDNITGTACDDIIYGYGGNDKIVAGAGDDTIYAGDGNDSVDAGVGNDSIEGGAGDDLLLGRIGMDTIKGGADNDTIRGGDNDDYIDGGDGDNSISGGDGNDDIVTGSGKDTVQGEAGGDTIDAGSGDDSIKGGASSDLIDPGPGADTVNVGDGDDRVFPSEGADSIFGGTFKAAGPTVAPTMAPTAPTVAPTGSPTGSPTAPPTVTPVDKRICVSVIDESIGPQTQESIAALWSAFRSIYPDRPFCLLQPALGSLFIKEHLFIPPEFDEDPNTIYAMVERQDEENPNAVSDWYNICDLDGAFELDKRELSIFIDNSGSMTIATVQNSVDLFVALASDFFDIRKDDSPETGLVEDWISPCLDMDALF